MALEYKQIQLTITTWISEAGNLYDYNSSQHLQKEQFKSVVHRLPILSTPLYYFFHLINKTSKADRFQYLIERRKAINSNPISQLAWSRQKFRLMTGVKLFCKEEQGKLKVCIKPISASEIEMSKDQRKYEQVQTNLPFLIVRTWKNGYQLKVNQVILMGRMKLNVFQINMAQKKQVEYSSTKQILNLDVKEEQNNQTNSILQERQFKSAETMKQCKFCYSSDELADDMLITPCNCKGSTGNIHLQCLKEWISKKLNRIKEQGQGAFYQTNLLFCQICHQPFPKAIIKNGKRYCLLRFLQDSQPYIGMKSQFIQGEIYIAFTRQNEVIEIGRLHDNGVVLEQQTVSRKHAQIVKMGDQIFISDKFSKYGTLVYEKEMEFVLGRHLKAIQVGNTVFSYKIVEKDSSR